jgi:membrane associated rhomboid family serine protease
LFFAKVPHFSVWLSVVTGAVCFAGFFFWIFGDSLLVLTCLSPSVPLQLWRWVSETWVHYNFFHWLYNVFTLLSFGSLVEQSVGSTAFLAIFLEISLASSIVQYVLSLIFSGWLASYATGCTAAGCSAAVLAFTVMALARQQQPYIFIFGCLPVPKWLFPWIQFLFIQLVAYGYNIFGHLTGMALGYAFAAKPADMVPGFFIKLIGRCIPSHTRASTRWVSGSPSLPIVGTTPARSVARTVDARAAPKPRANDGFTGKGRRIG